MTLEENKTMKEERTALLSLVRGGKGQQQKKPAKAIKRLLGPIIKVAIDRLIMDKNQRSGHPAAVTNHRRRTTKHGQGAAW